MDSRDKRIFLRVNNVGPLLFYRILPAWIGIGSRFSEPLSKGKELASFFLHTTGRIHISESGENMAYAKETKVPISRTRDEIERVLVKYGADKFMFGTSKKGSGIGFEYKGRVVNISIPKPIGFTSQKSYDQEERRMWRVLLIALKSKLELIDANLTTFEDEFLAQTMLPNGQNMADFLKPQIQEMIESKKMPNLLLPGEKT